MTGQVPRTDNVTIPALSVGVVVSGSQILLYLLYIQYQKWCLFQSPSVIDYISIELATVSTLVGYWAEFYFIDPIYLKIILLMFTTWSISKLVFELRPQ